MREEAMKKVLCIIAAVFCLTACGAKETKSVSCTLVKPGAGFTEKSAIDFKYQGDLVKRQIQNAELTFTTKDAYDQVKPAIEAENKKTETKIKKMDGIKHTLVYDDADKKIKETFDIDITKISPADYASITKQSESSLSNMKIDMKKTRDAMIKNGMTCTEMK